MDSGEVWGAHEGVGGPIVAFSGPLPIHESAGHDYYPRHRSDGMGKREGREVEVKAARGLGRILDRYIGRRVEPTGDEKESPNSGGCSVGSLKRTQHPILQYPLGTADLGSSSGLCQKDR